jgi:predicted DCC family thiol-disulfide oxidoreductase YuxK
VHPATSFELASARLDGDWYGAPGLTVLYDERCPLCRRLRTWLSTQATLVPIEYLASGSSDAVRRYPALDHQRTATVLTVIASDGAVYESERAWLVCAWALPAWQPAAEHFGTRGRLLLVKAAARLVDRHRHATLRRLYGPECDTCRIGPPPPFRAGPPPPYWPGPPPPDRAGG